MWGGGVNFARIARGLMLHWHANFLTDFSSQDNMPQQPGSKVLLRGGGEIDGQIDRQMYTKCRQAVRLIHRHADKYTDNNNELGTSEQKG